MQTGRPVALPAYLDSGTIGGRARVALYSPADMNRLRQIWERLHGSFWFIPSCLVITAIIAGVVIVDIDHRLDVDLGEQYPRIFGTGSDGAQGILESIATSVITVAGITFSITILILNEASSQYSPRVLRNFVRDRRNQGVLGAFLAVFVYCLIVLRAIHDIDDETFIPYLAVFVSIVLAIISIGVLIYFIHHIAYSIQATTIVERISKETLKAVDDLFPQQLGAGADEEPWEKPQDEENGSEWYPVKSTKSGYLSFVDPDSLLKYAEEHKMIVRIDYEVGDFVVKDTPLVSVLRANGPDDDEQKKFRSMLSVNTYRSLEQDAAYGIRQLVDIALKALSPSMNDTTTANLCIDHLTNILGQIIQRKIESPYRLRNGQLRVIAPRPDFEGLLRAALDQIREHANGNVSILDQILHMTKVLSKISDSPTRLKAVYDQTSLFREVIEEKVVLKPDKERLLAKYDAVQAELHEKLGRLRRARLTS